MGLEVKIGPHVGTVEHAYTHFSISMAAYLCDWVAGEPRSIGCSQTRWVRWSQLDQFAFPGANRKLFPLIEPHLFQSYIGA